MAQSREQWHVTSAIPGRIRLKATKSSRVASALHIGATRIAEHAAVTSAFVIPEARSIVVLYDSSAHVLRDMIKDVLSVVQVSPHHAKSTPVRLTPPDLSERSLVRLAPLQNEGASTRFLVVSPQTTKVPITVGGAIGKSVALGGSPIHHITAQDISLYRGPVSPIIAPAIAVVLLAIDVVPVALALTVLALGSIPIARQTLVGIKKRQITPDTMDFANVVLVVIEGSFLQAGVISLLVQTSDLIRKLAMQKTRKRLLASSLMAGAEGAERVTQEAVKAIEETPLGDSEHQQVWTKAKNSFSIPLAVLALTAFAITRDPGYLIGLMRPRADFNASLCFGVPGPLLTAMTRSASHGPLLRSSQAVERLAQIDAIVFASVGSITDQHILGGRLRSLMQRGILRYILPTEAQARIVRRTAERAGIVGVVAEPMPDERHSIIQMLVRHGHHVALIDDGIHSPHDIAHADVHVVIDTGQNIPNSAHVVLAHADLSGFVHAIDHSREAVHAIRRNTAMAASAAGINLLLSLVPPVAASAVNTATTALVAANSLRSTKSEAPPERPPHLPHRHVKKKPVGHGA